jgi:hypothetical protein
VSLGANGRHLPAPAAVEDPTDAIRALDRITTTKQIAPKRVAKAFNPVARDEVRIFRALLAGEHIIRGFTNPDIRDTEKEARLFRGLRREKVALRATGSGRSPRKSAVSAQLSAVSLQKGKG